MKSVDLGHRDHKGRTSMRINLEPVVTVALPAAECGSLPQLAYDDV
jgi:hypothetical protein